MDCTKVKGGYCCFGSTRSMEYVVTTEKLTKIYGKKAAVQDIDLKIGEGEIYGLIGRNGAGKTTIMRMLSGLSNPTSGSFSLFGKNGPEAKKELSKVGVLIEEPGIFPKMNAYDNLRAKCIARGCDSPEYINGLLELVGLSDTGKKKAGSFSLGMRQRLGIALALAGDPKLIILDEPINGLDPQGIVEVRNTLSRLRDERGITIMISSHILDELGKLADHYGIIDGGKLIDEFTTDEMISKSTRYTLVVTDKNEEAAKLIRKMNIGEVDFADENTIRVKAEFDRSKNVVKKLVENDIFVKEVNAGKFTLEDYFLSITGGGNTDEQTDKDGSVQDAKV